MANDLSTIPLKRIDGSSTDLNAFRGKVLLIVNVASKCGLTPQYEGLEKLYEQYQEKGLEVLGFPANEFGAQEPGTNDEIQTFCTTNFGVKFPMFQKIAVKGPEIHPLYKALTAARPKASALKDSALGKKLAEKGLAGNAGEIQWNFEKFVVSRDGRVMGRFAPDVTPQDPMLTKAIEMELAHGNDD